MRRTPPERGDVVRFGRRLKSLPPLPRPPRRRRSFGMWKQALVWCAIFGVTIIGYGVVGPIADDYRSSLRTMRTDCRVITVVDGDTVELGCPDMRAGSARIVGFDTPELFSPRCPEELAAAEAARRRLVQIIRTSGGFVGQDGTLEVALLGGDRYGRRLVDMRAGGRRVAEIMTSEGHARRYLGRARGGWC